MFLPANEPVLYRHFDADGCLLYIGSTVVCQLRSRHLGHVREARWWGYVSRVEHEKLGELDRHTGYRTETSAIHAEQPIFNRMSRMGEKREAEYIRSHSAPRQAEAPVWPRLARAAQVDRILREVGVPVPSLRPRERAGRPVAADLGEYLAATYFEDVMS